MHNHYNPFKENRTEQMRDLWKYYVPFPGMDATGKPIVVEGGRGSGKTMFFQCNSWRQKLQKLRKEQQSLIELLDEQSFVGIYYRVDTTFVSAMCHREEDNWDAIFETYLTISILQEILDFIGELNNEVEVQETKIANFVNKMSKRFYKDSEVETLKDFQTEANYYLDSIEDIINGEKEKSTIRLRLVNAQRAITEICNSVNQIVGKTLLFKIFIDEYETLQEYQQKVINSLIKHSTLPVIFNIGLRPHGMKTKETISTTETIEAPHDYEQITLCVDDEDYLVILREICKKRIALGKEQGKIPRDASENIEYYLGQYSMDDEIRCLEEHKSQPPHINSLKHLIEERGTEEGIERDRIRQLCEELCEKAPMINSRLHYVLLQTKTQYTPKIEELYVEYTGKTKRYSDWMHNRKFGLIFLLCKELRKEKQYYGFDVFATLSSNIVRYFLELCEQSFRIAFLNDFVWSAPIDSQIQTDAARYVSDYKVVDISGYEPYGMELRIFVQYLGQIFYRLHTNDKTTLGEPEPNHFNTKDLSLSGEVKKYIDSAVTWNVLQPGEATKRKQSVLSPETVDFYLNKIYVPYFGISYRNKRKINLSNDVLKSLFSGEESKAKNGFNLFFKEETQTLDNIENLNKSNGDENNQLSLFGTVGEEIND